MAMDYGYGLSNIGMGLAEALRQHAERRRQFQLEMMRQGNVQQELDQRRMQIDQGTRRLNQDQASFELEREKFEAEKEARDKAYKMAKSDRFRAQFEKAKEHELDIERYKYSESQRKKEHEETMQRLENATGGGASSKITQTRAAFSEISDAYLGETGRRREEYAKSLPNWHTMTDEERAKVDQLASDYGIRAATSKYLEYNQWAKFMGYDPIPEAVFKKMISALTTPGGKYGEDETEDTDTNGEDTTEGGAIDVGDVEGADPEELDAIGEYIQVAADPEQKAALLELLSSGQFVDEGGDLAVLNKVRKRFPDLDEALTKYEKYNQGLIYGPPQPTAFQNFGDNMKRVFGNLMGQ